MSSVKRLQFSETIAAPPAQVYQCMLAPDTYRDWTSSFMEGSYYEGSWEQGQRIRFLGPGGEDGMVAEIAENRPAEFVSIRHLGYIAGGVEDTESEAVRAWAPAYENYTFRATPDVGTQLIVDQDVTAEYEQMLSEGWRKGLARLKALCEAGGGAAP